MIDWEKVRESLIDLLNAGENPFPEIQPENEEFKGLVERINEGVRND